MDEVWFFGAREPCFRRVGGTELGLVPSAMKSTQGLARLSRPLASDAAVEIGVLIPDYKGNERNCPVDVVSSDNDS